MKPRRPAQLRPEQIELIEGAGDTAASSQLAHTSAQAVVPLGNTRAEDPQVVARVKELISAEGIDVLAESWVSSPEESLPGILWRGYLLDEWIRRYPEHVQARYAASRKAFSEDEPEKLVQVPQPDEVRQLWEKVFEGDFRGDFAQVLRASARFTDFLGRVEPVWIDDETHPLATQVTLRDTALLRTAREFQEAGERLVRGVLA